jgi:hypothetical protein
MALYLQMRISFENFINKDINFGDSFIEEINPLDSNQLSLGQRMSKRKVNIK